MQSPTSGGQPLSHFLEHGGAVVGGAAALGATSGYVAAALVATFGHHAGADRRLDWAARGGYLGGLFGIAVLAYEAAGLG